MRVFYSDKIKMSKIICPCGCNGEYSLSNFQNHYKTTSFSEWLESDFENHKDKIIIKCQCGGGLYNTCNQYNHYKSFMHKQWETSNQMYDNVLYVCPYCCYVFKYKDLALHKMNHK